MLMGELMGEMMGEWGQYLVNLVFLRSPGSSSSSGVVFRGVVKGMVVVVMVVWDGHDEGDGRMGGYDAMWR